MHSQPKNRRDNRGQGQGQYQGSPGQRGRGQGGRGQGGRGQGNRGQGGRGQGPNRPAPLMQIPRRNFDNFPRPMMFQRPGFPRNNNVRPLFQQSPRMTMRDEMMFHQRRMSPESRHKILINPHFSGYCQTTRRHEAGVGSESTRSQQSHAISRQSTYASYATAESKGKHHKLTAEFPGSFAISEMIYTEKFSIGYQNFHPYFLLFY